MAMTDLCRACVEAELPRARESFGPREVSQGWMQCWQDGGAGVRAALGDYRDVTSVMTARVLQLQVHVAGLGQAAGASRCPEGHLACPVLLQVGTVGHQPQRNVNGQPASLWGCKTPEIQLPSFPAIPLFWSQPWPRAQSCRSLRFVRGGKKGDSSPERGRFCWDLIGVGQKEG